MAFTPAAGIEPIPGYQLLEKLGSGGFGEVWKVSAPGELTKAIKIVFGNLEHYRAEQELKALRRIKEVRHPFLLSLERIEVIDGQLLIVTELADKSLMDCFQECRMAGLPGIPREELIGYLRDAAEALDYMQESKGLQHLDVKPQNLLLLAGRIKVADFGLVKDLAAGTLSTASGITPVYATPEAFDGKASKFSDQYSLAIVYQEMLTGVRPYAGTSALELAAQHVIGRPQLATLPAHDRPVVARALSKVPDHRYASCREFIQQLVDAKGNQAAKSAVSAPTYRPARQVRPLLLAPGQIPGPQPRRAPTGLPTPADGQNPLVSTIIRVPPELLAEPGRQGEGDTQTRPGSENVAPWLRPALYLGIGNLAACVLRRLRPRLTRRYGDLVSAPFVQMLFLDVDRATIRSALRGTPDTALSPAETLLTPLHPPEHYRGQSRDLLEWIDRRWLYGIPRSRLTEGLRPLGRLALVDNLDAILNRLRTALATLTSEATQKIATEAGWNLRETSPRIFLIGAISGGTAGGMVLEVAYAVRQILAELEVPADGLAGMLLHGTGQKPADAEMARLNAYATLRELAHFSRPEVIYPGDPIHGLLPCGPGRPPFEDCYLAILGEGMDREAADASTDAVAEYLALDSSPEGGSLLDKYRKETRTAVDPEAPAGNVRIFGIQRLGAARDYLAERAAATLCRDALTLWTTNQGEQSEKAIEVEAEQLAVAIALDAPSMLERLQATVRARCDGDPAAFLDRELIKRPDGASLWELPPESGAFKKALGRFQRWLARGEPFAGRRQPGAISLAAALRAQASELGNSLGESITEWLRTLIECPGRRLCGAEHGTDWFGHRVRAAVAALTARRDEVKTKRGILERRILGKNKRTGGKTTVWLRMKRATPKETASSADILEYFTLCLEETCLKRAHNLFGIVGQALLNFRHELAVCREQVRELARLIAISIPSPAQEEPEVPPGVTLLVPGSLDSLTEAETGLMQSLGREHVVRLDDIVQQNVLQPAGGLWAAAAGKGVFAGGRNALIDGFREGMLAQARTAVLALLAEWDAATTLVDRCGNVEAAWQVITTHLDAARPSFTASERPQVLLIGMPTSVAGGQLRELTKEGWGGVPITVVDSSGDILICHELAGISVDEAANGLIGNDSTYAALAARVWTRLDINWCDFVCPASSASEIAD
jgi:serine/threonine protein kinase